MEYLILAGLTVAAVLDWRTRRIPNWLTFTLSFSGLFLHSISGGMDGFGLSISGLTLGLFLLYVPFALGGVGGGDVKLLGAIGAFAGPAGVTKVFLAGAILGGVLSLVEIARHRAWKKTFSGIKDRVVFTALTGQAVAEDDTQLAVSPIGIPYAISLAGGFLCIHFMEGGVLQ